MSVKLTKKEESLKKEITDKIARHFGKSIEDATPKMIYIAAALTARDEIMSKWMQSHKAVKEAGAKKLYYISFEFLMGRLFSTNILNLIRVDEYERVIKSLGYDFGEISQLEHDAGLGNGGLGRLAACFIDSLTTMELPAYGCTIRYEYGLFKQKIVDGYQTELPDPWLEDGNTWEIARPEETVSVKFGGVVYPSEENGKTIFRYENSHTIFAVPYDVPLVGYNSKIVNKLRLWSARSPNRMNMQEFNSGNYIRAEEEKQLAEVISKVLYPEDSHNEGKELRLKQQYFLVSATLQWILREFEERYNGDWHLLPEKAVIHINDTHPTLAIPELMRILIDEKGLGWDEAWSICAKVFAFTNHTVMSEALEKWEVHMFRRVLPRIFMIVEEIDRRLKIYLEQVYPNDPPKHKYMSIIANNKIYMANICLVSCFAVNGVSKLHTKILTDDIFADYYHLNPSRFFAITNGITFRRWILGCNPALTQLISSRIGNDWIKDYTQLERLIPYAKDEKFKEEFASIKHNNKLALTEYIRENNGIEINPNSIFDVQAKRLHEYKRQLMNILHIIAEYDALLENPTKEYIPKTYIFAAKAAPGYTRAKLIIKLINSVAEKINSDERIGGKIKVVFLENYGVSIAEKLVVAADISEQISTAGKEASGTGNMKFMLNGAITIGTMDGANVEMLEQLGPDNIYIFGLKANEVYARSRFENTAEVNDIYTKNRVLKKALDHLTDGTFSNGNERLFKDLYETLLFGDYKNPDEYMVIRDFEDYSKTHDELSKLYKTRDLWIEKSIMNTACAGFFSSDRTIAEYNNKIWHLTPVKIK